MHTKVLLIDGNSSRASMLNRALNEFGYEIAEKRLSTKNLLEKVDELQPDIVIIGVDFPEQETLDSLAMLYRENPRPVVVFAETEAPKIIAQAVKAGVSAFIVDDIQAHRLTSIINVAIARFEEQQNIRKELELTRKKLAGRKILDKAKGILMKEKGYSEDEAYQCLRKMAMDKGQSLEVVAESVIDVFGMMKKSLP